MNQRHLCSTGLFFLSIGSLAGACSSDFDSCEKTGTCPSFAGTAGNGGETSAGTGGGAGRMPTGGAGTGGSASGGATPAGGAGVGGGSSGNGGSYAADAGQSGTAGQGGEADQGGAPATAGAAGNPEAGSGGEQGGEGGKPHEAECERDGDCDDDIHCNGTETCDDGECRDGIVPCANPDAQHCTARCEEGASAAVCVFEAVDDDEDGHKTALCEANPGDDCDDHDDDIHPDAPEECDGIDNDCDELVDTQDGVPLAGTSTPISGVLGIDIAWSNPATSFFLIYSSNAGFTKASLSPIGTVNADSPPFYVGDPELPITTEPHIVGGASGLLVAHDVREPSLPKVQVTRTLDPNGAFVSAREFTGAFLDFAWRGTASDWIVSSAPASTINVRRITPADLRAYPGDALDPEQMPSTMHIATAGDDAGIIWQNVGTSLIKWVRVSPSLELAEPEQLSEAGYQPDIASIAGGYALAWTTGSGLAFALHQVDGTPICSREELGLGLSAGNENRVALVNTARGTLALVTSVAQDKVTLVRFGNDCETLDIVHVADSVDPASPNIATGNGYVGLAWSNGGGGPGYVRVFSDMLCE